MGAVSQKVFCVHECCILFPADGLGCWSYSREDRFIISTRFIQDFAALPGQYDKQLLEKKEIVLSCLESFLGLLPHMLKTDLTVLMYRKRLEDLMLKDYEKPL